MTIVFRDMRISFQDYAKMNFQYMLRKQKLRLLLIPVIFCVVIVANLYNSDILNKISPSTLWLYLVGIVFFFAWIAFAQRRAWRKRYDNTQFLQSPATYSFSNEGVSVVSLTTQGAAAWETFDTLLLMKELAILTTRNFTVYFLDFCCLEAPATKADFLALMHQHGIPVK